MPVLEVQHNRLKHCKLGLATTTRHSFSVSDFIIAFGANDKCMPDKFVLQAV